MSGSTAHTETVVGFLHTAELHVPRFDELVSEAAPGVIAAHLVDEELLDHARLAGVDEVLRERMLVRLRELASRGSQVVVCTCSTVGAAAEALQPQIGVPVLRVDRPLAETAVRTGRRVALVATLTSTLAPSRRLLEECATTAGTDTIVLDAPCLDAWELFEASDHDGYLARVAEHVRDLAVGGEVDVIVLAQASMAPAAELVGDTGVPVLSAPTLAVARATALAAHPNGNGMRAERRQESAGQRRAGRADGGPAALRGGRSGPVDAVLFDLDGVLVDSRLAFARCVNAALAAHGLPCRLEHELHRFLGPPLHGTFAQLGAGEAVQSCVEAYRARYRLCCVSETTVVAGIPEVLDGLEPLTLLVVTSKPQALAEPLLEAVGLRDRFAAVVGPGLEAEHEAKATTVARALRLLGPDRQPVMVGDRNFDVAGAAAHGLPTVGVLWGIGEEHELRQAGAAVLAGHPQELLDILRAASASRSGG